MVSKHIRGRKVVFLTDLGSFESARGEKRCEDRGLAAILHFNWFILPFFYVFSQDDYFLFDYELNSPSRVEM